MKGGNIKNMNFKKISVSLVLVFIMILAIAQLVVADGWTDTFGQKGGTVLKYIFGAVPDVTANVISNVIITVAVWVLIMLTFGDIIATFSTFSKGVSWGAACLIGIIAANLGWTTTTITYLTGVFAIAGTFAVYIGLGAAFVAFLIVNLGISSLGGWIKKRRAMMEGEKAAAGGIKAASGVKVAKSMAKAAAEGE